MDELTPLLINYVNRIDEEERAFLFRQDNVLNNGLLMYQIIECMTNGIIWKNKNYYEIIIPRQNLSTFKSNFRMSRDTFVVVVDNIIHSQHFRKRPELFGGREQITPEKALLISLWTLATPESYRAVGDRFNVAKSSVFFCLETIIAVLLEICPTFIRWPNDGEKLEISQKFERYGLPGVCGAIDGCHIRIKKPQEHGRAYFNRKKFYSMVLQGICRENMLFIDCDIRWPGSVHDSRVLRTSDIYPVAHELCGPDYYIIGDKAYPIKNWLMSPYRENGHLHPEEIYFNNIVSKTRVIIENAFALLKGRFRRLKELLDRNGDAAITQTIMACCVLHNICLLTDGDDVQQFINEGRDEDHILMVPDIDGAQDDDFNMGVQRRLELTNLLWNNRPE